MKKVLILKTLGDKDKDTNRDWNNLRDGVADYINNDAEVTIAALSELVFEANGAATAITHAIELWDIADFDLVIIRKVGDDLELAIACAHYLKMKQINFIDEYLLTEGKGKLAGAFLRERHKLSVPRTVYADGKLVMDLFRSRPPFGFPFVLKADVGSKGRDNYLVESLDQLDEILRSTDAKLIAQPFISNDGDYRILVLNNKPSLAILRRCKEGSHLNNTSQGGTADIVEVDSLGEKILGDAVKATQIERLSVAGVDVLIEKDTGNHYILEVNRAPQLATGAFVDEKMAAYSKMVKELLGD